MAFVFALTSHAHESGNGAWRRYDLDAPPQLTGGNAIDERYGRTSLHKANIDVLPYWPWSISDMVHPRDVDNLRFRSKLPLDNGPD